MKMLTSLPGANTSPTIFAVTLWVPLTSVYVSPTAVLVSVRNSVLTSISRALGGLRVPASPEISARPDQAGSPSP